jgi:hypothetical protein
MFRDATFVLFLTYSHQSSEHCGCLGVFRKPRGPRAVSPTAFVRSVKVPRPLSTLRPRFETLPHSLSAATAGLPCTFQAGPTVFGPFGSLLDKPGSDGAPGLSPSHQRRRRRRRTSRHRSSSRAVTNRHGVHRPPTPPHAIPDHRPRHRSRERPIRRTGPSLVEGRGGESVIGVRRWRLSDPNVGRSQQPVTS